MKKPHPQKPSPQRWRRQVPLAHAIADFASHRAKLVIELDGGQHTEAADAARTAMIEREGYRVLRFWNNEVQANPEGVYLKQASPFVGATESSHP